MTSPAEDTPLKLLTLDGGRIRGLSELLIIKQVMHRLMVEENAVRKKQGQPPLDSPPKPCDYFDLIGGTSTGGIIALMLGRLRMDVDTAINYYDKLAKQVFSEPKRWPRSNGKFRATKLEEVLKSMVKDVTGDSESSLLESNETGICRTFVCAMNAYDMSANIPVLFRTYQSRETHSGCKIWEAARATSAAPTFFKHIMIGRDQPYIDSGLGRNNPSRAVLDEAKAFFGARHIGCLVSIGTGLAEVIGIEKPGLIQHFIPTDVISALRAIATDCEATHEAMLHLFANSPNIYFRLNVEQGMQKIQLSELGKMANVEAHTMQYIKRKEVDEKISLLVNVVRVPTGQLTIEQLISPRSMPESIQGSKGRKLCPPPVVAFTGRKDILEKMHRYFDPDCQIQCVFVLFGLGGSGKSQIAFKFIQQTQAVNFFSDVFYIDATNEQTLQTDFTAITPTYVEQSVKESRRWLASHSNKNWLLFFDNADDTSLDLGRFFPPCASGNILVTTRNPELRTLTNTKNAEANVTKMDHEDAISLLLHLSKAEETEENKRLANIIVQELHYFALAISQAGAFIQVHSSLRAYPELYRRERDNIFQNKEVQSQDQYGLAVYATWKLSYNKLDLPAISLLQICSVLHHEGISQIMFEKAALSPLKLDDTGLEAGVKKLLNKLGKQDIQWSSWTFQEVIRHLTQYSLIEYDNQNDTYSIHPLVQHWSMATMGAAKDTMQKYTLAIIGLSISLTFRDEDYRYQHQILQHSIRSISSFKPEEVDIMVAAHIAIVFYERGHWNEARALQMVVVEKRKQILGDDHLDTLISMANLALTYGKQGLWKKAETLEELIVEKRQHLLGDNHPDTLESIGNLSATYYNQGRWNDAEKLAVKVVEKMKAVLNDDHRKTLRSMSCLASTYRNQGRWKEAEDLENVVLEKSRQILGDDHSDTLTAMVNLTATYRKQGLWKKAKILEKVAVDKRRQVLGDDHPDTLTSMSHLASTYWNQGHWDKAKELEDVVMEKRKSLLGDNHPDTLLSMSNLASIYQGQGLWNKAEILGVEVIEKMMYVLGSDHPDTLTSMENLASIYKNQGEWKKAETLENKVVEKRKQILGSDHPDTLTSILHLANTYKNHGYYDNAEILELDVMEMEQKILGEVTLMSMSNLAVTYQYQGRWKEAEELGIAVVMRRQQDLGDDHPDTLTSMGNLALTYQIQGHWEKAEALGAAVLVRRKWALGDDHPDTLMSMGNLGVIYREWGYLEKAEVIGVTVLKGMQRVLGDNHHYTLTSMSNLAVTYGAQHHWDKAMALEEVVIEKRKHLLGNNHPDTRTSLENLAITYRELGRWHDAEGLERQARMSSTISN